MENIIGVLIAILLTIAFALFDLGCYFLQKDLYEYKKKGGSKYEV